MNERIQNQNNYISITEVYKFFSKSFWLILITTLIISVGTVFYSLSISNIYQSKSILITNSSLSRINQSARSGVSGLSSLSSLGIGSSAESLSNLDLAYETFKSRTFFEKLAGNKEFLRDLYAVNHYNQSTKKLEYNQELYDIDLNKWVNGEPSRELLYKKFNSQVMFIARDRKKGFIILNIRAISPELSYKWHRMVVNELNESIKISELEKSNKNIAFLKVMSEKETNFSINQIIANLLTNDLKKVMLSNSTEDYSLEYLDEPFVPEKRILPQRSVICILGFISGFIISILLSLARSFIRR